MNFNEFNNIVNEIRIKQPILFSLESDKIPTEDIYKVVEKELKCRLPKEYKKIYHLFFYYFWVLFHELYFTIPWYCLCFSP